MHLRDINWPGQALGVLPLGITFSSQKTRNTKEPAGAGQGCHAKMILKIIKYSSPRSKSFHTYPTAHFISKLWWVERRTVYRHLSASDCVCFSYFVIFYLPDESAVVGTDFRILHGYRTSDWLFTNEFDENVRQSEIKIITLRNREPR